jgi:uncharacterized protein (TIGR02145 family)
MSMGKGSIIARMASLATVAVFLAFLAVGCGGDDNPGSSGGGGKINYGTLEDSRDGKTYKTVKIGNQTWMAENLDYQTTNSWCYNNADSNCVKYGRLYTWDAAITACPRGWHLPTSQEWDTLMTAVGGTSTAGTKLKSKSPNWDGTDDYRFSALPGGRRNTDGSFRGLGSLGNWWSVTEYDASVAYIWYMKSGGAYVGEDNREDDAFSVRCLQD